MNNFITVLIPSIGRESLSETLNSIPEEYPVIVYLNTEEHLFNISALQVNRWNIKWIIERNKVGPGAAKQYLIDSCTTDYFMILDDDDKLDNRIDYLKECKQIIEYHHLHWLSPNIINNDPESYPTIVTVDGFSDMNKYLFDYNLWDEDYAKNHLYTLNSTIIHRQVFNSLQQSFHLNYADDLIPVMNMMMNSKGGFLLNRSLISTETPGSVSRRLLALDDVKEITKELTDLINNSQSIKEKILWTRALNNVYSRVNEINYGNG